MEFPDDFNAKTFPAGPRLMTARIVSVATMVVFLLIVCVCGLLLWTQRSVHVHPFLISINPITGQWDIVGHEHGGMRELTTTQSLQESVIGKFIQQWYFIPENISSSARLWSDKCERETNCTSDAQSDINTNQCELYCISSQTLYDTFINTVVPDYTNRIALGEHLSADMSTLQLLPLDEITADGGNWQIRVTLYFGTSDEINILAYARIGRDTNAYPQTLGYYVSDFNAYRTN